MKTQSKPVESPAVNRLESPPVPPVNGGTETKLHTSLPLFKGCNDAFPIDRSIQEILDARAEVGKLATNVASGERLTKNDVGIALSSGFYIRKPETPREKRAVAICRATFSLAVAFGMKKS